MSKNNRILSLLLASSLLLTGCGSKRKKVDVISTSAMPLSSEGRDPYEDNDGDFIFLDEFGREYPINRSMAAGVMEDEEEKQLKQVEGISTPEPIKEKYEFGYTIKDVSIWDSLETKCFAGYANQYQKLMILSTDDEYSFVEYIDDNDQIIRGYIPVENYKKLPNTFIAIDKSRQELTMYIDGELVLTTSVVTGHYGVTDTPSGCFGITGKETGAYLIGKNADGTIAYKEYVDYWIPFNEGIGIHDAEYHTHSDGFSHGWRNFDEVSNYTYTYNGSHGCVNTANEAAKEIYENSQVGTKVLVYK